MCRVSARWCSTSCPGASFYCKRKPPRSIGYGRTRRETRRSADESVEDTSRSETRHVGHDSHSHLPSDQVTILWRGPVTESARFHPARSIPRVHYGKYQQSARISACTENAGAEGFSNGPNPVDPRPATSSATSPKLVLNEITRSTKGPVSSHLSYVIQPASQPASQPVSLSFVRSDRSADVTSRGPAAPKGGGENRTAEAPRDPRG